MSNKITFEKDGHQYTIVPIENSNEYSVIKDNRFARKAGAGIIDKLFTEDGECVGEIFKQSDIVRLFEKEVRHG